jgi:hypothetical protein
VTERFGDRDTFAIEIGPAAGSAALRAVDLWATGKQLTLDDNVAYVPSLLPAMRRTATDVRERSVPPCPFPGRSPDVIFQLPERDETKFREHYWFLYWDEIVDNVSKHAFLDCDSLVLIFAFRESMYPTLEDQGRAFVATIGVADFVTAVGAAVKLLEQLVGG